MNLTSSLFGALTLLCLSASPALAATSSSSTDVLAVGTENQNVRQVQRDLKKLGYFPRNVHTTDYFGPLTEHAVVAFEKDHKLSVSTSVTPLILHLISSDAAQAPESPQEASPKPQHTSVGQEIAHTAEQYLGAPYVWGGTSPSGFDCSGFTQYVFAKFGIDLPRTAAEQATMGAYVAKSDLRPGDLVFFDTSGGISHVGIYIGSGKFVDAASTKVEIDLLDNPYYWANNYVTARRVR